MYRIAVFRRVSNYSQPAAPVLDPMAAAMNGGGGGSIFDDFATPMPSPPPKAKPHANLSTPPPSAPTPPMRSFYPPTPAAVPVDPMFEALPIHLTPAYKTLVLAHLISHRLVTTIKDLLPPSAMPSPGWRLKSLAGRAKVLHMNAEPFLDAVGAVLQNLPSGVSEAQVREPPHLDFISSL